MPPPTRNQVFISYSHNDTKWRDDLEIHLKPYRRVGSIISWSDEQITSGSNWFDEINSALINTNVAVLLVTPNFLASDFIYEHELGPFLKQAQQGGVRILWVHVRTCAYKLTALKDYQAVLNPARPLADMTEAERDRAWVKICEEIEKAVNSSKDAAPQSGPTATQDRELSAKPAAHAARWFVVGCVLLLFAFGLGIWGFFLGTLTSVQQRLLVWALALASGLAIGAFVGSIKAEARGLIPGIAITATSGFAVWLIMFFFPFPESKIREQSSQATPSVTATPRLSPTVPPTPPPPKTPGPVDLLTEKHQRLR
jgi:hypothetical protein